MFRAYCAHNAVLVPDFPRKPEQAAILIPDQRLTNDMNSLHRIDSRVPRQLLRFSIIKARRYFLPCVVAVFAATSLAYADPVLFGSVCSENLASLGALCSGGNQQGASFEDVEMDFFGSQFASDANAAFSPVSYYFTYTANATPVNYNSDLITALLSRYYAGLPPTSGGASAGDPPADPPQGNDPPPSLTPAITSNDPVTDIASFAVSDPAPPVPAGLDPVPEPYYPMLVVLAIGFMLLILRWRVSRNDQR